MTLVAENLLDIWNYYFNSPIGSLIFLKIYVIIYIENKKKEGICNAKRIFSKY